MTDHDTTLSHAGQARRRAMLDELTDAMRLHHQRRRTRRREVRPPQPGAP